MVAEPPNVPVDDALAAARREVASLRRVVDDSADCVLRFDRAGRIVYANVAAVETFGLPRDEFFGKTHAQLGLPAASADAWATAIERVAREGRSLTVPLEAASRAIEVTLTPERDADGAAVGVLGVAAGGTARWRLAGEGEQLRDRLEEASASLPGMVFQYEIDAAGGQRFPLVSGRTWDLFRLTPEEMLADAGLAFARMHPEDVGGVYASLARSAVILSPWTEEYRVVLPDGEVRWHHGKALPRQRAGGVIRWSGVVLDVTPRKGVEGALIESEARFRRAILAAPIPILLHAEGGEVVLVNDVWCRLTGYVREELPTVAAWVERAYAPEEQARVRGGIERLYEREELAGEGEFRLRTRAGETCVWEFWSGPVGALPDGRRLVISMGVDVTERRAAEQALAVSEEFLTEAGRLAQVGGWQLDPATREVRWTDETFRIHGLPVGDAPSLEAALDFYEPEDRPRVAGAVARALEDGTPYDLELRLRTAEGNLRWVQTLCKPLVQDGEVVMLRGAIQDVTERREAEEQRLRLEATLRHAQKLESLGLLAGGIAHDFNNLLGGILVHAELIGEGLPADSPDRTHLERVLQGIRQAAGLTQQMLAYAGKADLAFEPTDLNGVILAATDLLRTMASKKVELQFDLAGELPLIEADPSQLQQIVMNLAINGAEAIHGASGVVTVATSVRTCSEACLSAYRVDGRLRPGAYVQLVVSDTGVGLEPEAVGRIFDPFYSTKVSGRGLGLAAILGILRTHGGGIKVDSAPGAGTTFSVLFPAGATTRRRPPTSRALGAAWRGAGRVLLADDDEMLRRAGRVALRRLGFEVVSVADGLEALEAFRTAPDSFRCAVLDLKMPGLDGGETFKALRQLRPDLPVILSSGYPEQDSTAGFERGDLAGFLQKPYTTARLREVLRDALER